MDRLIRFLRSRGSTYTVLCHCVPEFKHVALLLGQLLVGASAQYG
jgi:hypothetical protein